jgi:bifunctional polynucleotide phosphatase/kinase
MAPIIELLHAPRFRQKMAAFDYDWTLVRPIGYGTFARNEDDWRWLSPSVPAMIKKYYDDGYFIAIFTNQTKAFKRAQVLRVLGDLGIPMAVCIGVEKTDQKPHRVMYDALVAKWPKKPDGWTLAKSVFVGDALGRRGDWSDSDRVFAETVGFASVLGPEEALKVLNEVAVAPDDTPAAAPAEAVAVPPAATQELVIFIGFPGSGKSTIAERSFGTGAPADVAARYAVLHGDVLKTPAKMKAAIGAALGAGQSPVVDATNASVEKRAVYIAMAREAQPAPVPVRCIHVATPLETAYERNKARPEEQRVPRIAYAVYKKHFAEPTEAEGCSVVRVDAA